MLNRRELLKQFAVGTGSALFAPVLGKLHAEAKGIQQVAPKRLVFVVRANGLRPWGIVPKGLEKYGEARHKQETVLDKSLKEHKLHETMSALEPLKDKLTIIQDLSGRAAAVSDPHGANFGTLGVYRSDNGSPPAAETTPESTIFTKPPRC